MRQRRLATRGVDRNCGTKLPPNYRLITMKVDTNCGKKHKLSATMRVDRKCGTKMLPICNKNDRLPWGLTEASVRNCLQIIGYNGGCQKLPYQNVSKMRQKWSAAMEADRNCGTKLSPNDRLQWRLTEILPDTPQCRPKSCLIHRSVVQNLRRYFSKKT